MSSATTFYDFKPSDSESYLLPKIPFISIHLRFHAVQPPPLRHSSLA